jgi:hypothetical protein
MSKTQITLTGSSPSENVFGTLYINPLNLNVAYSIFKNLVCTLDRTQQFTITKINVVLLFKEIIPVYTDNDTR